MTNPLSRLAAGMLTLFLITAVVSLLACENQPGATEQPTPEGEGAMRPPSTESSGPETTSLGGGASEERNTGEDPTPTPAPTPTPLPEFPPEALDGDYDYDDDGLIEVRTLAQLDAIRYDALGRGTAPDVYSQAEFDNPVYYDAFPNAIATDGTTSMGCPETGCIGYELIADLDFDTNGSGQHDQGDAYWNDGAGWMPIGQSPIDSRFNFAFLAVFDGGGYTISNMYSSFNGLFLSLEGGLIRNVNLASVNIHYVGWQGSIGGLVGSNNGGTIIASCVTGEVSSVSGLTGGLVGRNEMGGGIGGRIIDSCASVVVTTGDRAGGLVAWNDGHITGSYATGDVTAGRDGGGLVGDNGSYTTPVTITDSYATGNVSAGENGGGLVGCFEAYRSPVTIARSYATGNVSAGENGGGLVGEALARSDGPSAAIAGSYATGDVSAGENSGGLVGSNLTAAINASYATGRVSGGSIVGGLVGSNLTAAINASYATGRVSGGSIAGGLVGSNFAAAINASY